MFFLSFLSTRIGAFLLARPLTCARILQPDLPLVAQLELTQISLCFSGGSWILPDRDVQRKKLIILAVENKIYKLLRLLILGCQSKYCYCYWSIQGPHREVSFTEKHLVIYMERRKHGKVNLDIGVRRVALQMRDTSNPARAHYAPSPSMKLFKTIKRRQKQTNKQTEPILRLGASRLE